MRRSIIRVGAGLAAFAGTGVAAVPPAPPAATAPAAPAVVATVGGEPVRLDQVDAAIKAQKLATGPLTAAQLRQLRAEVAADLVDDRLLKQFLARHAPKVEPAEIDRHLQAFTASLAKQGKTFAEFLKESNQTETAVRETWTTLLQLHGYVRRHVTDAQLKQYHAANRDHFDKAEVRASHIVLRVGPGTPPAEKAAAREKLQAVRAAVAAGTLDFAAAARKHSQCPSAADGGDLGYLPRKGGLMDEAFTRAAFALKVGELSGVVESDFGLHLIRVADRKPGTPTAFEACAEEVRDTFVEDFRAGLVAKLRTEARVQVTVP